jgi:hypothetical protein
VARDYMHDGVRTLHHQQGTFYRWVGSHYIEVPDEEIRAQVYSFLDTAQRRQKDKLAPFDPNKSKLANVTESLAAVTQLSNTLRPPVMLNDSEGTFAGEVLACRNGLLHLPTRTMYNRTKQLCVVVVQGEGDLRSIGRAICHAPSWCTARQNTAQVVSSSLSIERTSNGGASISHHFVIPQWVYRKTDYLSIRTPDGGACRSYPLAPLFDGARPSRYRRPPAL